MRSGLTSSGSKAHLLPSWMCVTLSQSADIANPPFLSVNGITGISSSWAAGVTKEIVRNQIAGRLPWQRMLWAPLQAHWCSSSCKNQWLPPAVLAPGFTRCPSTSRSAGMTGKMVAEHLASLPLPWGTFQVSSPNAPRGPQTSESSYPQWSPAL